LKRLAWFLAIYAASVAALAGAAMLMRALIGHPG
jgi:hypothetical protein